MRSAVVGLLLAASSVAAVPAGAVVNGAPVGTAVAPWAVAITRSGSNMPVCTGALVTPSLVLTAASCFTSGSGSGEPAEAVIGRTTITDPTRGERIPIFAVIKEPTGRNLALAALSYASYIRPVALSATSAPMDDLVGMVGWGKTDPAQPTPGSSVLNATTARIWPPLGTMPPNQVRVRTGLVGVGLCGADSGAPLVTERGSTKAVVGVFGAGLNPSCGEQGTAEPLDAAALAWVRSASEQLSLEVPTVVPPNFGYDSAYAYVNGATGTVVPTRSATNMVNGTKPLHVIHLASPGRYAVSADAGAYTADGNWQVQAMGSKETWCWLDSASVNLQTVAYVDCATGPGQAVDSDFEVSYVRRGAMPVNAHAAYFTFFGLPSDLPDKTKVETPPSLSFSTMRAPSDEVPTVLRHLGPGSYDVTLNDISTAFGQNTSTLITAVGGPNVCVVVRPSPTNIQPPVLQIACYDNKGDPVDTGFSFRFQSLTAWSPSGQGGYALIPGAVKQVVSKGLWPESTAIAVSHPDSLLDAQVSIRPENSNGAFFVTAETASQPARCRIMAVTSSLNTEVFAQQTDVTARCYSASSPSPMRLVWYR